MHLLTFRSAAAGLGALLSVLSLVNAEEPPIAVIGRVAPGYTRLRGPDGRIVPETFAFGNGGVLDAGARDASLDGLGVHRVAAAIAPALRAQGYVPSADPRQTKLLIMLYWGATQTPADARASAAVQRLQSASASLGSANSGANLVQFDVGALGWAKPEAMATSVSPTQNIRTAAQASADSAMTAAMASVAAENREQDAVNARNARLLGYDESWEETSRLVGTPFDFRRRDVTDELEDRRYYVVLLAYDFQTMWKQKRARLLWETRYSLSARDAGFSAQLAAMSKAASACFGRDSRGLIHRSLPDGRVDVGSPRIVPESAATRP